jgi:hypothetical protein
MLQVWWFLPAFSAVRDRGLDARHVDVGRRWRLGACGLQSHVSGVQASLGV